MASTGKALGNGRKDYQERRKQLIFKLKQGTPLEDAMSQLSYTGASRYNLRHDPEIRAIILETQAARFVDLVPMARNALKECLESTNERVKSDTAKFVLKESGALAALQQAKREDRQPTPEEIVAATSRLESLLQGAKQAQERNEQVIEHQQYQ